MKTLIKKLTRLSLVWQVTIVFSLIMIIPAIVTTASYFEIVRDNLLKEANKKVQENLKKLDSNMNSNINNMNSALNQLVFSQEFQYYLNPENNLSTHEKNYYVYSVQNELLNIRYVYTNQFNRLVIYSSNKQIDEFFDWSYHIDRLFDRDYYSEIMQSNSEHIYGNVRVYDRTLGNLVNYEELENKEELVLPIYQKISDIRTKKCIGLIEVDMTISKLVDSSELLSQASEVKYLIFDRNQKLVFASDDKSMKEFDAIKFPKKSGTSDITVGDADYLIAYDKDDTTGLTRVAVMDKKKILASTTGVDTLLVLIAILSIVFVVVFTNVAARIFFRKLKEIDKMITHIEAGRFDVRIKVDGVNEISRISESFNHMAERLQGLLVSMVQKEKAQREAEIHALQAQINPHFLYNTLENMRMQCEIDEYYVVANELANLGDLMRYSLHWESPKVKISEELNNIEQYIEIMRMRFNKRLIFQMECPEHLRNIMIPKLILQPLVENCFIHGFKDLLPPWEIYVNVFMKENKLIISVEDNGKGMGIERLEEINDCIAQNKSIYNKIKSKNSIGIINVNQRVGMICPAGSGMHIESEQNGGTKITLTIVVESGIQNGGEEDV
ncbi:integral membrane sensor signal transduction histidine kinase [Ruminiclostridium papyrosolvens DSM 2782]|uniref:Integral membrane sensor signal transduction histidine kinase n=1 Tax=Ruminiclostridium papyrosolvens DSM 2782 TaxID=588581 RepID=F1TD80_9FIRM|nr:sensor histidine kinase [Ruminiclostridium papyrosolvens]EGD47518.1 integral membrane sensor signal transduction histidine kinase [Ruminiclostridium papyrosolvens DSM 2782]WES36534.1 sensor histidine kinase [Ruminiclostridium papyrosolvens DSM 2782]